MYARVWHFKIVPGKFAEFAAAVKSLLPEARKERGFRGFLVLRSHSNRPESQAMMIGLWESREHLRASDQSLFLPRAIAHLITCSEGFPLIQEHEVLVSELFTEPSAEWTQS
jgi:quinol monooxygenase YgiN